MCEMATGWYAMATEPQSTGERKDSIEQRHEETAAEVIPSQLQLYIGGEWVESSSGETFETRDPTTGNHSQKFKLVIATISIKQLTLHGLHTMKRGRSIQLLTASVFSRRSPTVSRKTPRSLRCSRRSTMENRSAKHEVTCS